MSPHTIKENVPRRTLDTDLVALDTSDRALTTTGGTQAVVDDLSHLFGSHDLDASPADTAPLNRIPRMEAPTIEAPAEFRRVEDPCSHVRVASVDRQETPIICHPDVALDSHHVTNHWAWEESDSKCQKGSPQSLSPPFRNPGMLRARFSSLRHVANVGYAVEFKWVLGDLIGRGHLGSVHLVLNVSTGELIAVKQVEISETDGLDADPHRLRWVKALKTEWGTLKRLDHPYIVKSYR
jgi:hypothetical protein